MVYYVSGSNIFGQWSGEGLVINEFRVIKQNNFNSEPKLLQINWAYNILNIEDNFYLSGAWNGKVNQFVKVPLPDTNLVKDETISGNHGIIICGNDYYLILLNMCTNSLLVIDLKMEKEIKKVNFNTEEPHENVKKKQKIHKRNLKVVMCNDSCLYLTPVGIVYCGILPSYVDTNHCKGEVCDVQCGYEHYVLLTDSGAVYTWGNGRRLQLGHGDVSNLEIPTEVEALAGIKITKICAGGWHSLALSEFGDLYAWGWNDVGQLGIKQPIEGCESSSLPTVVDLFEADGQQVEVNIQDIACGSRHSAIMLEDNTVWTSGCNKYGQLGFSVDKCPSTTTFVKVFHCDKGCTLMCGPWTTVIVSNK